MPREIEIKYRIEDPHAIGERIAAAGGVFHGITLAHDTLYDRPDRRLIRSDCAVRVRRNTPLDSALRPLPQTGESAMWTFKGPRSAGALKDREEWETAIGDAAIADHILRAIDLEPILCYEKRRATWILDAAEVVLDELPQLGHFMEIEAERSCIAELVVALELDTPGRGTAVERHSYPELVRQHLDRHDLTGALLFAPASPP